MDTRLLAVVSERGHYLHDRTGREQTPESMGIWAAESVVAIAKALGSAA